MDGVKESRLLPVSLILGALAVAGMAAGGVYLSSSSSSHGSGETFSYKEVQPAPALQPTPFDQTIPDDAQVGEFIELIVQQQAAAARSADTVQTVGSCADYEGGFTLCGAVRKRYEELGGVDGELGRPLSNQVHNEDKRGSRVVFQRGVIFYSPTTGAQPVTGVNLVKYTRLNFENSPLGYPIGEVEDISGGTMQAFEGDTYLTASEDTGVHYIGGRIFEHWQEHGGSGGEFGFPASDLLDVSVQFKGAGDRAVLFPNGKAIVSSSRTGDVEVVAWTRQQDAEQLH